MPKTPFLGCSVREVDFTDADLSESHFTHSDLSDSVFYKTILKKVDFREASNFSIDPELNSLAKAKFTTNGLAGLLNKYGLSIEN